MLRKWSSKVFPRNVNRVQAQKENQVIEKLSFIQDASLNCKLLEVAKIQHLRIQDKICRFTLNVPSLALPQIKEWRRKIEDSLKEMDFVDKVQVDMKSEKGLRSIANRNTGVEYVKKIVAVSSCKGGVGKSTVAVNLAYALDKLGASVGILDADIYGPSLPIMVSADDTRVFKSRDNHNFVLPVNANGVKCMSFGYVNKKAAKGAGGQGAAVMRGPMVSKLVDQLILGTDWGELDYLIVDMPPGTGDIHMSLSQQVEMDGTVIVTTPQLLSVVDVKKGIAMFEDLKVPTLGIVENMAYFDCIHGHRHYPFGRGHLAELKSTYKIATCVTLPIAEQLSKGNDTGRPVASQTNSCPDLENVYEDLAHGVALELVKHARIKAAAPVMQYDSKRNFIVIRIFGEGHASETCISPLDLRLRCQCAACVDEFTRKQLVDPKSIPDNIHPTKMQQKGNYAYAVVWSDGHSSSLYTFEQLRNMPNINEAVENL